MPTGLAQRLRSLPRRRKAQHAAAPQRAVALDKLKAAPGDHGAHIAPVVQGNDGRVHTVSVSNRAIMFECPNEVSFGRAKWLLQKEPGTIAWLDTFAPGSVFWDIGANIGVYALYAAIVRHCNVLAFEPTAPNYYGLNRNITLNKVDRHVRAYCVALDDKCSLDAMQMHDDIIGTALHAFSVPIDYKGDRFQPAWQQGALALSIDTLVSQFSAPFPSYIKVDVDGLEVAVIQGGRETFADPRFKSVLVEVNLADEPEVTSISSILEAAGLSRDDTLAGNVERKLEGARIFNLVYRR